MNNHTDLLRISCEKHCFGLNTVYLKFMYNKKGYFVSFLCNRANRLVLCASGFGTLSRCYSNNLQIHLSIFGSQHTQIVKLRGGVLMEVIVFNSAGNFRQIPLRCMWSDTSKELSPAVSLPLLFDVLTSLVQPPERSPCFPQSPSLLLWNVYRNFMSSIRTKCLSEKKKDML